MDLLLRTEAEKQAKKDLEDRRLERLLQVRKQTKDWVINKRKLYAAKKSDQVQKLIDEATVKRQEEFKEAINQMTQHHDKGMEQIGAAHRAAEFINQMELERKEKVQKIQHERMAHRRHLNALKIKRQNDAQQVAARQHALKLKEEVRQKENIKAKELVIAQPYQIPTSSAKLGKKAEPYYPESPTKYLDIPGVKKSPKKKRRTEHDPLKVTKKPVVAKEPRKSSPSVFGIVAGERASGAAPPIITRKVGDSSRSSKQVMDLHRGDHGGIQPVTYFDASVPLPPIRYKAPAGLVRPVDHGTVKSDAWIEGQKLDQKAQLLEEQRQLDLREMERRAQIRGEKALRVAKLEQRYKRLEADLLEKNQIQGFQPVLDSSTRNSLLGLEDPKDTFKKDEPDRGVQVQRTEFAAEAEPVKSVYTPVWSISNTSEDQVPIEFLHLARKRFPSSSSSSSWANSIKTLSSFDGRSSDESEDEDSPPVALVEILRPRPRRPASTTSDKKQASTPLAHVSSSDSSLSGAIDKICKEKEIMQKAGRPGKSSQEVQVWKDQGQGSSSTPTARRPNRDQVTIYTEKTEIHGTEESSSSSWSNSFRTLSTLKRNELSTLSSSAAVTTTDESSSSSTMAVVQLVCSPGKSPKESSNLMMSLINNNTSSSSTESSLTDALNNLCFRQETLQWAYKSTSSSQEEAPPLLPSSSPLGPSTPSSSFGSGGATSILSLTRRVLNLGRENISPVRLPLEPPSNCSSIKLDTSGSSRSSGSKETNRGTFGTNLGNTLFSTSIQSEQRTSSSQLQRSSTSTIQKLANEWSQVSIEKPPWWRS